MSWKPWNCTQHPMMSSKEKAENFIRKEYTNASSSQVCVDEYYIIVHGFDFCWTLIDERAFDRLYMYFPSSIKWRMAFGFFEPFSSNIYTAPRSIQVIGIDVMWFILSFSALITDDDLTWRLAKLNFRFPCRTAAARSAFYASDLIAVDGEWVMLLPIYTVSHFQRSCRYRGGQTKKVSCSSFHCSLMNSPRTRDNQDIKAQPDIIRAI